MAELLNPWWVTGIVDGEGCFYASTSFRTKTSPRGGEYPCVNLDAGLQVWMRDDDRLMLEELRSFFGCGNLWQKPVTRDRREKVSGANPACAFRIQKMDDLVSRVIPHFEAFPLRSRKAADFEIWKEIVMFVESNLRGKKGWRRRFPDEVGNVVSLCDRLKKARKYEEKAVNHG